MRYIKPHDCEGCAFRSNNDWEMPCAKCSRIAKDYYRTPDKTSYRVMIGNKVYISCNPTIEAVHGKTGEVTIGNFYELKVTETIV